MQFHAYLIFEEKSSLVSCPANISCVSSEIQSQSQIFTFKMVANSEQGFVLCFIDGVLLLLDIQAGSNTGIQCKQGRSNKAKQARPAVRSETDVCLIQISGKFWV